jgi:hypothetical protein
MHARDARAPHAYKPCAFCLHSGRGYQALDAVMYLASFPDRRQLAQPRSVNSHNKIRPPDSELCIPVSKFSLILLVFYESFQTVSGKNIHTQTALFLF